MISLRGRKWVLCLVCAAILLFTTVVRLTSLTGKADAVFFVANLQDCPSPSFWNDSTASAMTLIDLHDFRFVTNNASKCRIPASPNIVVLVHSAPRHFKRRQSIRATWGNESYWLESKGHLVRLVFLLGQEAECASHDSCKTRLQSRLEWEHSKYGDLVQGNFVDSYRNLTYKHVMGLLWVGTFCSAAQHVLKVDDDVFVDPFQLSSYFKNDVAGDVIRGSVCKKCFVKRGYRTEKWRVSFKEYSNRYFPDFCAGIGLLTSARAASKLYSASCRVPFFWIDDVYATGMLAEAAGIQRVNIGERITISEQLVDDWLASTKEPPLQLPVMIAHSKHFDDIVYAVWNKTKSTADRSQGL